MAKSTTASTSSQDKKEFRARVFVLMLPLSKLGNTIVENVARRIREHNERYYKLLGMDELDPEIIENTVGIYTPSRQAQESRMSPSRHEVKKVEPFFFAIIATEGQNTISALPFHTRESLFGIPHSAFADIEFQPQNLEAAGLIMDYIQYKINPEVKTMPKGQYENENGYAGFYTFESSVGQGRQACQATYVRNRLSHVSEQIPFFYRNNPQSYVNKVLDEADTLELLLTVVDALRSRHLTPQVAEFLLEGEAYPVMMDEVVAQLKNRLSQDEFSTIEDTLEEMNDMRATLRLLARHQDELRNRIDSIVHSQHESIMRQED